MALRGRKIENFDGISLAALSQGLLICVLSHSFQKSSTGWPHQPPTERVSDQLLVKNWIIGHFGARNDPTFRICNFFDEMKLLRLLRPLRFLRLLRSLMLQRF